MCHGWFICCRVTHRCNLCIPEDNRCGSWCQSWSWAILLRSWHPSRMSHSLRFKNCGRLDAAIMQTMPTIQNFPPLFPFCHGNYWVMRMVMAICIILLHSAPHDEIRETICELLPYPVNNFLDLVAMWHNCAVTRIGELGRLVKLIFPYFVWPWITPSRESLAYFLPFYFQRRTLGWRKLEGFDVGVCSTCKSTA